MLGYLDKQIHISLNRFYIKVTYFDCYYWFFHTLYTKLGWAIMISDKKNSFVVLV